MMYLMYRLICQKPAAQMALLSTFFQMFIVLGMYNFGLHVVYLSTISKVHFMLHIFY